MTMQRKTITARARKGADDRTFTFCITSGAVDRDNDTIDPGGWQFDNWLRNPVVLPTHAYDKWPIARGANLRRQGNSWLADFVFAATPEGDTALALVAAGMLNACSVGFRPLESSYDNVRGGTNFQSQELLEVSVCPVPANPEALVQRAQSLGLSTAMVRKMFATRPVDDDRVVLRLRDEHDGVAVRLRRASGDEERVTFSADDLRSALRATVPGLISEIRADLQRSIPRAVRQEMARRRGVLDSDLIA